MKTNAGLDCNTTQSFVAQFVYTKYRLSAVREMQSASARDPSSPCSKFLLPSPAVDSAFVALLPFSE